MKVDILFVVYRKDHVPLSMQYAHPSTKIGHRREIKGERTFLVALHKYSAPQPVF